MATRRDIYDDCQVWQAPHPTSAEEAEALDEFEPDRWYIVDRDHIPTGGPYDTEEEAYDGLIHLRQQGKQWRGFGPAITEMDNETLYRAWLELEPRRHPTTARTAVEDEGTDKTERDWIVIDGQPVDCIDGGGYEFHGPFTEQEARKVRAKIIAMDTSETHSSICVAVQLLGRWVRRLRDL